MNYIDEEIYAIIEGESLAPIGMPRRSGRYPWGSGDNPYQNACDYLGRVDQLKKQGFTYTDENGVKWTGDKAIYKSLGMTSTQYRIEVSLANDERKLYRQAKI